MRPTDSVAFKVNECVEEIAQHGETKTRFMSSLRSGGSWKLSPEERKDALELMHTVGVRHVCTFTTILHRTLHS